MIDVPPELQDERSALIAEIYEAFNGVSREGGVSWSEALVIDDYGSEAERQKARLADTDRAWSDVAANDEWDVGPGTGGWTFLDPIGVRYYLPAAMLRTIRTGDDASSCLSMTDILKPTHYRLNQWSLLNDRQRRCVGLFLRFMAKWIEMTGRRYEAEHWNEACEGYWNLEA